ncbi:MAG TPA: hypothetical protein VFR35_04425 [Actinoplanes sp.]|nr:hypothetical protein [Actinoplanes sp.]
METQAVAIWMILLLVVALPTALMTVPRKLPETPEADDLRYAAETAVAAGRAAVSAQSRRAEWESAQQEVDAAWAAYDEADRAARRTAAAAAYPVMCRRRVKHEKADRERFLHRSALAACRTGQISIAQLNEALAHRGWNARLHPAAQESELRNAVREHRYTGYLRAVERERAAWEAAEQAAAALRILRAEACAAALPAGADSPPADAGRWVGQWVAPEPVRPAAV